MFKSLRKGDSDYIPLESNDSELITSSSRTLKSFRRSDLEGSDGVNEEEGGDHDEIGEEDEVLFEFDSNNMNNTDQIKRRKNFKNLNRSSKPTNNLSLINKLRAFFLLKLNNLIFSSNKDDNQNYSNFQKLKKVLILSLFLGFSVLGVLMVIGNFISFTNLNSYKIINSSPSGSSKSNGLDKDGKHLVSSSSSSSSSSEKTNLLSSSNLKALPKEDNYEKLNSCKNPFEEFGYLNYDESNPIMNNWIPFDSRNHKDGQRCGSSDLLSLLIGDLQKFYRGDKRGVDFNLDLDRSLPWLVNRTIILIGDSIERFHLRDFCDFLSFSTEPKFHSMSENGFSKSQSNETTPSRSYLVDKSSNLKNVKPFYFNRTSSSKKLNEGLNSSGDVDLPEGWPVEEKKKYLENFVDWSFRDNIRTSPWVCEVPSYNFTIISLFNFGLEPYKSGYYYSKEDWFNLPSSFSSRIDHILIPILKNLNVQKNFQKDHLRPDLIEINSGLWDLRQFSEEDSRSTKTELSDSNPIFFDRPLSQERLDWYRVRLIKVFEGLVDRFPDRYRSTSKQNIKIDEENKSGGGGGDGERGLSEDGEEGCKILWRSFHHPLKHSLAPYNRVEQLQQFTKSLLFNNDNDSQSFLVRLNLTNRLKYDSWGEKVLGHEHHFRDPVHPKPFPSNILWSQMILWELRESVLSKQNNKKNKMD